MIIGTRVDHRLVHGQVAFSWISAIGANCILVANDAYQLLNGCPQIKELNVGGTSKTSGSVQITSSVFLNDKDISDLKQLAQKNIEIFNQMVPTDKKIDLIKRL